MPAAWSLREFRGSDLDKGRSLPIQVLWFCVLNLFFLKWWMPARLRPTILRLFGAKVGRRVLIRHRVRVHYPWKLAIGDDVWIGEEVWFMNLEPVSIGSNSCLSQGARIVTGSHDRRSPSFEYDNAPIVIGQGVWVATGATVLRGSKLGDGAVVAAGAVATGEIPENALVKR